MSTNIPGSKRPNTQPRPETPPKTLTFFSGFCVIGLRENIITTVKKVASETASKTSKSAKYKILVVNETRNADTEDKIKANNKRYLSPILSDSIPTKGFKKKETPSPIVYNKA